MVREHTRHSDIVGRQPSRRFHDSAVRRGHDVRTGGAAAFLRVLREELIPDTERRYRATSDRTYIGYSLGGLFGGYALFHAPELFQRMILVSPSFWWDDRLEIKEEEIFAKDHKSLPVRLFMSDGELETSMIANMTQMATALANRHYEGLQLHTRIFAGESHMTTYPVAITRGLQTVFAEKPTP
jgi:predicted alpha/beta superfamily hydrolase